MIDATQSIEINASIDTVWEYIKDIRRWAVLFPGCRECTVIDEHDSKWTLKVGAGGLVRTVNVLVHVDLWAGPERVNFSFKLEGDPVEGGGSYCAVSRSDNTTEASLSVRVQGSGAMAPMWEAVSKPLLPTLAKSFASKLKAEIEKAITSPRDDASVSKAPKSTLSNLVRRFAAFLGLIHEV
jgi:carbon monoxide dehydrogenase subunit G